MPKREPTAIAQVGLRIRESLRAEIEQVAKQRGVSLNTEIVDRLEMTFSEQQQLGSPDMLNMARLMAAAFLRGGQAGARARGHPKWSAATWIEDPTCYSAATAAVRDVLVAAAPGLDFGDHVSTERRELANKILDEFGSLISRGYPVKVTKKGEEK